MIRKIIHIDRDKCNGCGACAKACHEGAIDIVDGKAVLVREHFCDGLGDCLPACPMDAISFEEREAPAYDEAAVQRAQKLAKAKPFSGCPGMRAKQMQHREPTPGAVCPSQLSQWPVQIKLAGVAAPYFEDADILIAADCTAYAYGNFHADFIRGRITLIGCPKLDAVDYTEYSPATTFAASRWHGWKCRAAAASNTQFRMPLRQAARIFRAGSQ